MRYRDLGRTGLSISELGLGTVELGLDYGIEAPGAFGRPDESSAVRLVHAALDRGVNFVDTVRAYGDSERVLGLALRDRRDRVVLTTKVDPRRPDGTALAQSYLRHFMRASLETSLRMLRTDHVDVWMIHSINQALLAQRETLAEIFAEAQARGQIGWTGASFYGAVLPEAALQYGLFDVMQVTYSVLDQRLSNPFFPLATDKGVGIVVRSVLLKGALTERGEYLPDRLAPLRLRSRRYRDLMAASGTGATPAQGAICFALSNPQISPVLVGVRTLNELQENLQALTIQMPSSTLRELHSLRLDDESLLDPSTWGIP